MSARSSSTSSNDNVLYPLSYRALSSGHLVPAPLHIHRPPPIRGEKASAVHAAAMKFDAASTLAPWLIRKGEEQLPDPNWLWLQHVHALPVGYLREETLNKATLLYGVGFW